MYLPWTQIANLLRSDEAQITAILLLASCAVWLVLNVSKIKGNHLEHLQDDITGIKADVEGLKADTHREFDRVHETLEGINRFLRGQ